jgi:hypothetical protein
MSYIASDLERALLLLAVSAACLVVGYAFRKWPEKIQDYSVTLDGSIFFLGAQAHLRLIRLSGLILMVMAYAALVPAAMML